MKFLMLCFFNLMIFTITSAQDSTTTTDTHKEQTTHEILQLTKTADSDKYGLTGDFPVKVGTGKKGGPYNQRAYLDLLRDGQGNKIKYARIGACCPYSSENALFGGTALVDRYGIVYKDKNGKKKKAEIFISFYDYEEPMIPVGFQAATDK